MQVAPDAEAPIYFEIVLNGSETVEFSICNEIALSIFNPSPSYVFGASLKGNVIIVLFVDVIDVVTRDSLLSGLLASFVEECTLKASGVEFGVIEIGCLLIQTSGY